MSNETTVVKTIVQVAVDSPLAQFVGDFSVETITNMLIGAYPWLANSVASEQIITDEEGNVCKSIRFAEGVGMKGLSI